MKIKLIIFSFLALIGIGGATIGGTAIVNNQPENVVMNSITDAYNDFFERDEIKPVYNMLYGGSFEFNSDVSDRGDDIKIAGKLYFDESEIMLENFIYEYDDGYFNFNVNGNIYVSEEMIYIQEDTFFSEGFGIVYNELVDEVSNSILAPGSQTDYELDEESFDIIMKYMQIIESFSKNNFRYDTEKLLNNYVLKFWDIFCNYATFSTETREVSLADGRFDERVIYVKMTNQNLEDILKDFFEFISKDKEIRKYLKKLDNEIFNNLDLDKTVLELFEEKIDEITMHIDDYIDKENFAFNEIEIKLITPKSSSKLLSVSFLVDDETIFNLDCGSQGIKESNIIILTLDVGKFTYEIEENSKDTFASSLIYERDITYQYPIFEFECNKKTGDFKLFNPGFTKGNIDKQGDSFLITITKSGDHSNNADCAIYYILDQNDKMPDAPKEYKSISDIKQSTIEEFLENIYEVFGDAM